MKYDTWEQDKFLLDFKRRTFSHYIIVEEIFQTLKNLSPLCTV